MNAGEAGLRLTKREIARKLSCSVRTVDRGITRLRALGLIDVEERHLSNGTQIANVYRPCEEVCDDLNWYCVVAERLDGLP